jgi:uncharacterized membrane protein YraQ (UPF0718 family)
METGVRAIGQCKKCKTVIVGTVASRFVTAHPLCECGTFVQIVPVKTKISAKKCGAGCTHAAGPNCSCECGGENHGSGWTA